MTTRHLLIGLAVFAVLFALLWGLTSFVLWEWCPCRWSYNTRGPFSVLTAVAIVLSAMAASFFETKHQ